VIEINCTRAAYLYALVFLAGVWSDAVILPTDTVRPAFVPSTLWRKC
jgi:hypothetical protein